MKGACPFECCTYTNWTAKNEIKVFQNAQDTTSVFLIAEGEEFKAVTGNVFITQPEYHLKPITLKIRIPGFLIFNDQVQRITSTLTFTQHVTHTEIIH